MKRAAFDIGSNTVRLLVSEQRDGKWNQVHYRHKITRLSGKFDGNLHPDSINRTVAAIAEFADEARAHGATELRASCTGVTRKASNTSEFLNLAEKTAGLRPVVISGEQEARLTALGAVEVTGYRRDPFVLFDIGGFSTEIIAIKNGEPVSVKSHNIGVVRLCEDVSMSDPPTTEQLARMDAVLREPMRQEIERVRNLVPEPMHLVGTAGTATTLAAMAQNLDQYDFAKVEGYRLKQRDLAYLQQLLVGMKARLRLMGFPSLEPGREDVIIPGTQICLALMEFLGQEEIHVTNGGILEGLIHAESFLESEV